MGLKALFFDIDGTLLNSKRVMSESTYDSLKRCSEKGLLLCTATARPKRLVFHYYDKIPGNTDFIIKRGIYYNGGVVIDQSINLYQHTPILEHIVLELTDFVDHYDDKLQVAIQHEDDYHSFKHDIPDDILISWGFTRNELISYQKAKKLEASKIMVFSGLDLLKCQDKVLELYNNLNSLFGQSVNLILADSGICIQIVAKNASKGNAIKTIIQYYGIKPEEVAVFGDDTPDAGMFGMFGYSIAMENAKETLKEAATHVTLSIDEDGVVYALKDILHIL